jgi:hypothetical protein
VWSSTGSRALCAGELMEVVEAMSRVLEVLEAVRQVVEVVEVMRGMLEVVDVRGGVHVAIGIAWIKARNTCLILRQGQLPRQFVTQKQTRGYGLFHAPYIDTCKRA